MSTYNGEKYLQQQMDSILAQTYPIAEIIVQDDGSTDGTVALLRQYEQRVPQMHVYVNEHNLGFNRNFHSACLRATADYVAISDQDDVWMPHKIERQVQAIGPCNVCFSAHLRGRDMGTAHTVTPRFNLEALLFTGIAGHTMLIRRDFLQCPDSWSGDSIVYDWSIAINVYFFRPPHAIARIDEPLNWHRSHDGEAALLHLCWLCMRHRTRLYPDTRRAQGLRGAIRGFFYPFIFSWHCSQFDMK